MDVGRPHNGCDQHYWKADLEVTQGYAVETDAQNFIDGRIEMMRFLKQPFSHALNWVAAILSN